MVVDKRDASLIQLLQRLHVTDKNAEKTSTKLAAEDIYHEIAAAELHDELDYLGSARRLSKAVQR